MRTSRVALVPGNDPRIEVGEWCARDPTQFALVESMLRDVALLFAGASFSGPPSMHRCDVEHACKFAHARPMSDPPRLTRLDEPLSKEHPHLTFRVSPASTAPRLQSAKSAHRPCRYRSCGFHLRVKTASRTPGEERTLRTIENAFRRERPSHGCPYEPDSSWCPVKDTARNQHTRSPYVRTAARIQRRRRPPSS